MSFFDRNEYKTLIKIKDRLKEKCTLKNVILYWKYRIICYEIVISEFNNLGWDDRSCSYRWDKTFHPAEDESDRKEVSRLISKYGNDYDGMLNELDGRHKK